MPTSRKQLHQRLRQSIVLLLWGLLSCTGHAASSALEYNSATIGHHQSSIVTITAQSSEDGIPQDMDVHTDTTTDTPAPQQRWADHTSGQDPPLLTGFGLPSRDYSSADLSYDYDTSGITIPAGDAPNPAVTQKLLTSNLEVPLGNKKFGLEHILRRHSPNTGIENVSKFNKGFGSHEIKSLIQEASQSGAPFRVEGAKRVLDTNLGRIIGTDRAGSAVSGLRVVTDANGSVITAYPIGIP